MLIIRRLSLQRELIRRFASTSTREPKFSESAAFQGIRQDGKSFQFKPFKVDYYQSDLFKKRRFFVMIASLTIFIWYFGWLREASDLDEVWNAPPHLLTANLEKKLLKERIEQAKKEGKPTEYLEAELAYVDVKAEAMRLEYEKQLSLRARK